MTARQELLRLFHDDRPLAHREIFRERHRDPTPDYHEAIIEAWHGPDEQVIDLVFRGGGKSSIAEEAIIIMAAFREFRNGIVVSYSKQKAAERVHAIRHEIETNDILRKVFGDLVGGGTWGDEELVLSNGLRILAMGRGQSVRGVKFEEARPDVLFIDDIEDANDVKTPEAREKVWSWLQKALIPACEPPGRRRIRMAATPLHPESAAMRLVADPSWKAKTVPIYYLGEAGEKQSSWPGRWPIKRVLALEEDMMRSDAQAFRQEYLCQAEAPETKLFKQDMIKVEPRVRTWEAVYAMVDPARTTGANAATTGFAVWSWVGPKWVIWEGYAKRAMPDEIIADMFELDERYNPVTIGFEEDGLNQWALQPIRQEQVRRGRVLPLKAMRAPTGKLSFIAGIQPWFRAGEATFAKALPDLERQLLGYPNGAIDVPNALAYGPRLRPGAPIYDGFSQANIGTEMQPNLGTGPVWLALNATHTLVSAVAVQYAQGAMRVFGDYVREGDASVIGDILNEARLEFGRDLRLVGGPVHFDRYLNVGLNQALARLPMNMRTGAAPGVGRETLRQMLKIQAHGSPAFMVDQSARWTLRALSGGYARAVQKNGVLADFADEGAYRVLMEGLESFAGLLEYGFGDSDGRARPNATTAQGREYHSMVAGQVVSHDSKSDWNALLRGER